VKHSRDYTTTRNPELAPYFLNQFPPLEAQIIDLADEIAYLTADLDDGVESGLLEISHIVEHVRILARCYQQVSAQHAGIEEKYLFHEALQLMQNTLTADLIANTRTNLQAAGIYSLADLRAHHARVATFSPAVESERLQEKRYLYETLYTCKDLEIEHDKAEEVVTALFNFWAENPEELPEGYAEEIAADGIPRVVADYIAGMTDAYILQHYIAVKRRPRLKKVLSS
jgi:dGTPase